VIRTVRASRLVRLRGRLRAPIAVFGALGLLACRRSPEELPPPSTVPSSASIPPPVATATPLTSASPAPGTSSAAAPKAPPKVPGCPPDPEGSPMAATFAIVFPEAGGAKVEAELARNEHDVTRGLMYRTEMPADHGMLFQMPRREEQIFWMRNTCLSLDMLFLDDDGTVIGVLERVPILNEAPRTVRKPSRYVLEVNAGWAAAHGVRAGMRAKLPSL